MVYTNSIWDYSFFSGIFVWTCYMLMACFILFSSFYYFLAYGIIITMFWVSQLQLSLTTTLHTGLHQHHPALNGIYVPFAFAGTYFGHITPSQKMYHRCLPTLQSLFLSCTSQSSFATGLQENPTKTCSLSLHETCKWSETSCQLIIHKFIHFHNIVCTVQ